MPKLVLLAAAVPLVFAPTALADNTKAEHQSVSRVPDVDTIYDAHDLMLLVSLPVDGCRSRQDRVFPLSASTPAWTTAGTRCGRLERRLWPVPLGRERRRQGRPAVVL